MKRTYAIVISLLTFNLTITGLTVNAKIKPVNKMPKQVTGGVDVVSKITDDSDYSEMATLIKTANLQATLKTVGPYTIFAPNNTAFRALPGGVLDSLSKDPAKLAAFLRGFIIKGEYTQKLIMAGITAGKGKMKMMTVDGKPFKMVYNAATHKLMVNDASGNSAQIVSLDMMGKASVLHGINAVLIAAK